MLWEAAIPIVQMEMYSVVMICVNGCKTKLTNDNKTQFSIPFCPANKVPRNFKYKSFH